MRNNKYPNPDALPDFEIPRELTRLLEECSYQGQHITFLRDKKGIRPIMNFEDDIEMSGMVQWIVSWAMAILQANSENTINTTLENLLGPPPEDDFSGEE